MRSLLKICVAVVLLGKPEMQCHALKCHIGKPYAHILCILSCLIPQSTSPMWTIKLLLVLLLLHTFNRARFLIGYDCLLITSLLRGHLCVTPIKDDGSSHCGWDNISTYLHLSQKQIKTDMWAVCHTDTWSFPRKPAKSSECC